MYIVCFSSVPNVKQVHVADHGTRGGRHIQLAQRSAHAVIICPNQCAVEFSPLIFFTKQAWLCWWQSLRSMHLNYWIDLLSNAFA